MTPTAQSILGSAGVPAEFDHDGKTWKLGHPDQRAKARYEEAIVQAKARELTALRDHKLLTPAAYADRMEVLGGRLDRGEQAQGQPLWLEYTLGDKAQTGVVLWIWALLAEHQPAATVPEVTRLLADSGPLLDLAVRRVLPHFFAEAGAAIGLPPAKLEELEAAVSREMARLLGRLPAANPTASAGPS